MEKVLAKERTKRGRKRPVDVVVLSDIHLGTVGCHAGALNRYLKNVDPGLLILNGDIIDMWQFTRYYWPRAHMKVVRRILKIAASGTPVYYVTGNHDELLRKFSEQHLGNFHLVDQLELQAGGRRMWVFHGDIFDVAQQRSRILTRMGAVGYDLLILLNRAVNWVSMRMGRGRISLSKRIKDGVKSAVSFIGDFERTAAAAALDRGFEAVVCGHIHQPTLKTIRGAAGSVAYLNSGDWIENLTALEFHGGSWRLFHYRDHEAELEGRSRSATVRDDPDDASQEELPEELRGVLSFLRAGSGRP